MSGLGVFEQRPNLPESAVEVRDRFRKLVARLRDAVDVEDPPNQRRDDACAGRQRPSPKRVDMLIECAAHAASAYSRGRARAPPTGHRSTR
jgi:hypothetical protein